MTIDQLAHIALFFGHTPAIVTVILVGLFFINRRVFYMAGCLVLFTLVFNPALKVTFQVPLNPALGKVGFAFPSGHMQLSTVLYGWIAYKIPNLALRIIVPIILTGIGFSLIHFGYHNFADVIVAVFFGALTIASFQAAEQKYPKFALPVLLVVATIALIYSYFSYTILPNEPWISYIVLSGLVAFSCFKKYKL